MRIVFSDRKRSNAAGVWAENYLPFSDTCLTNDAINRQAASFSASCENLESPEQSDPNLSGGSLHCRRDDSPFLGNSLV